MNKCSHLFIIFGWMTDSEKLFVFSNHSDLRITPLIMMVMVMMIILKCCYSLAARSTEHAENNCKMQL